MSDVSLAPRRQFHFSGTVPGDKSITHRAYLLATRASGETRIEGALRARDTDATLGVCRALGADVRAEGDLVVITGRERLQEPIAPLDCMNAGTLMRLAAGHLAGAGVFCILTGDASLNARPMARISQPLQALGARIEGREGGRYAPLAILPARLRGTRLSLPLPSAQVKSAVLLAALDADGETILEDLVPTRDHTERLLPHFGAQISVGEREIRVLGGQHLRSPGHLRVPGDASHAAFLLAAAALAQQGGVEIRGLGLNPGRTGFLYALRAMGAQIDVLIEEEQPEPAGTVRLRSGRLRGIQLGAEDTPAMIDELPIIAALALCAEGRTEVRGAQELRIKETDRIKALAAMAQAVGGSFEQLPDGFVIEGTGGALRGGTVESFGDHRIAMAAAILSLRAEEPIEILGADAAAVSFPGFFELFAKACGSSL
ncbi:MAG: 3-phosphoshikimate 1-carboxyvinyltransferase [Thermaerobacter sp.]|nr:3-phosphoshikimate 1-carboxyvinyltransferase [Thermaerobacter sp.]